MSDVSDAPTAIDVRRARSRRAKRKHRHRRPRLRGPAARDGVRRGRLRRHRHRPRRGARRGGPRAPLLPGRRSGRALRAPRRTPRRRRRDYAAIARARRDHDLRPDAALQDAHARHLATSSRPPSRVAANLAPGPAGLLQSTTYPGTTEEIVLPILERGGREVGDATSSSATRPSASTRATASTRSATRRSSSPGSRDECRRRTELLYRQIVDTVVPVSSTMVAETAKLHENTFRAVNIALANELALMCDRLGISAWEVIEAASTKPFGVPAPLPRARPGRRLHPGRAPLPRLAPARVRLLRAADRGRARDQRADAASTSCRRSRTRSTTRPARSRARACCCSGWRTSPTCTTRASRRASR